MRKTILLFLTLAGAVLGQNDFYLKSGDRVVFYGDSITDQRLYTTFTETYVVTRFPNMPVTFVHSGWGGDRVTGGGGGPIDLRLDRDVTPYRPTVMTVMLGMNDGSYRAFDQKTFDTFSHGYEHIIDKVKKDLPGIRITVIQPSPFDDVTRPPTFDGGYNAVLERFSAFLKDLAAKDHLQLADLNSPVVHMLKKANDLDAPQAQKILPDRVHPSAAGHLVMAEGLLKAWHAPAVVTDVEIDAAAAKLTHAENTSVGPIAKQGGLVWSQTDRALPFPIDWNDRSKLAPLVMQSSDFLDALDRETLKVTGLAPGRYILRIDTAEAGTFSNSELAEGINLAKLAATPMMKQAMDVHALTLKRAAMHQMRWRDIQVPLSDEAVPSKGQAMAALDKVDDDLMKQQRAAAQPKPHRYELALQSER
jgi:lysophospholipase L1-like esterase